MHCGCVTRTWNWMIKLAEGTVLSALGNLFYFAGCVLISLPAFFPQPPHLLSHLLLLWYVLCLNPFGIPPPVIVIPSAWNKLLMICNCLVYLVHIPSWVEWAVSTSQNEHHTVLQGYCVWRGPFRFRGFWLLWERSFPRVASFCLSFLALGSDSKEITSREEWKEHR